MFGTRTAYGVVGTGACAIVCRVACLRSTLNPGLSTLRMTAILGISAFYHDSAAALVVDGEIVAAAQEERFTRKKHDARFPKHAVDYCLKEAGLTPDQLDYVGFYDKPLRTFERLLETYLAFAPAGFRSG
jgi:carbamoyltransferase